jgi:HTH-type transcriptional regulator, competence development regulator
MTTRRTSAASNASAPLVLIGQTIREIRLYRQLTQLELAARCGFNRTFIVAVEKGRQNASAMTLITIAAALGVLPSELFRSLSKATMRHVKLH